MRKLFFALSLCAGALQAQQAADGVFVRARRLVDAGNGAAGRLLIDSVMSATPADSPTYPEALYWRATLAATSNDAERDYRRLVVEYPLSSRVAESLLKLADLENARGDRQSASRHLEEFLTDNPKSDSRPRATLMLVRLLFDQGELPRGCRTLRATLADLPEGSVEIRNQLEFYVPRCMATDATPGGAVPAPPADTSRGATAKRDTATAQSTAAKGKYTLQVAAYKTKDEADVVAKKLKTRKLDVRVVGSGKLYRVRIGHYATRAAAVAAQKDLKAKKLDAVVTVIGAEEK